MNIILSLQIGCLVLAIIAGFTLFYYNRFQSSPYKKVWRIVQSGASISQLIDFIEAGDLQDPDIHYLVQTEQQRKSLLTKLRSQLA